MILPTAEIVGLHEGVGNLLRYAGRGADDLGEPHRGTR